jgi:hypothetical protein
MKGFAYFYEKTYESENLFFFIYPRMILKYCPETRLCHVHRNNLTFDIKEKQKKKF